MSFIAGANADNIFVNRNCGYCGQVIPKVNEKAFMEHVHECELKAVQRIKPNGKYGQSDNSTSR